MDCFLPNNALCLTPIPVLNWKGPAGRCRNIEKVNAKDKGAGPPADGSINQLVQTRDSLKT